MGTTFTATSKSADAPDIEPGLCDARFDGVTTKFIEGGQYGDGDRFVWSFTMLDDEGGDLYDGGDVIVLDALTSMSLNTTSKTVPKSVRFLRALCTDAEYTKFESGGLDVDSLIGRIVQADVAIRDSGWPTITNILPKRVARRTSRNTTADA